LAYLQKIDVNVLIMPLTAVEECRYHAGIDIDKHYIAQIRPQRTVLTHLGPKCDYQKVLQLCPPRVEPAFDNMVLEL
jgi:phosphoribosyl 1,2-cyclic phosphodiesterase